MSRSYQKSIDAFDKAKKIIPGGVNSPVRSFSSVEGTPPFIDYGDGGHIVDIDGHRYIDYVLSWGALVLGHCDEEVIESVTQRAKKSLSFGAPTTLETELCEEIASIYPFVDKIRLVNSGTEAVMSAIRLARGYTKRDKIIKFEGCYHGHCDALLVKGGSGMATLGKPSSPGIPEDFTRHTLVAEYNNLQSVERHFQSYGEDIACLIIEPVAGNMGLVPADVAFLQEVQKLCQKYGALLIFDEVMSGFRTAMGGACELTGITPDMVTWGKVIGGGMPIGAFGATKEIIECLSPVGGVYQAGTLSGNPISVSAGLASLKKLKRLAPFEAFERQALTLTKGLEAIASSLGIPMTTQVRGSMFGFFFSDTPVKNFTDATRSDIGLFKKFHRGMLDRGVYLACSAYEAGFLSTQTTDEMIQETLQKAKETLENI